MGTGSLDLPGPDRMFPEGSDILPVHHHCPTAMVERPPHGKEGLTYSALKGTRNDQHPGGMGPWGGRKPVALFHPESRSIF